MAFEKGKVLKAAEKFLSQGNINAAIKEYRQIVEHDQTDFTTLNMLGDLCVRAGKKEEAISCFLRIAEHYREQEFALKAIAMYKKIERLNPRDPIIAEKLAILYSIQGLVVDARAQYLILAETYVKEGLLSEAAQAFTEAGERLSGAGAFERSLQAFSRALDLVPHSRAALSGLVSAHVALGTAYEAAELLEKLIADKPDDIELITLLLEAHLAAQDAAGAERATSLLMVQDATNYNRFLDVARLYLSSGDLESAARVLAGVTERVLAGREENQLLELVEEVLARDPEQIMALRLLVRIHWWQRDMDKLRAALERLTEAAEAAGETEDERYALTQLVRLVPDATRYTDRLNELGGAPEELLDVAAPNSSGFEEVPTFNDFAILSDDTVAGAPQSPIDLDQVEEFEFNSVAPEAISDPSASFADLNEDLERGESFAEPGGEFAPLASSESAIDQPGWGDRDPSEIDFSSTIVEQATDASELDRHDAMLRQELESVDFYIGQGYLDIALDTLEMLERQFEAHPEIEARRQQLRELGQTAAQTEVASA